MEPGHNQFQSAYPFARVYVYGDAAAVVLDPDYVVTLKNHEYFSAEALHGLVYSVVNHLKDQVVEAVYAGSPYIHTGALAHRLKAL
jgi:hypothetical protein